jgi:hypothetical protein
MTALRGSTSSPPALLLNCVIRPRVDSLRVRLAMSPYSDPTDTGAPDRRPVNERLEEELARLDARWRVEQKRHEADYSGEGEGPNPELPNAFRTLWSFMAGMSIVGFGVWHMTMPGLGPFFLGLLIVLIGIWFPLVVSFRHRQYIHACRAYQRRRAEVLSRLDDPGRTNG